MFLRLIILNNKMKLRLITRNKKGDKLLSVYWFAILVIVAVGIVLMVNTFYGDTYDVRNVESRILAQKAADCIYFGGKFNPELFSSGDLFRDDFRDNFLEKCNLNFSTGQEFVRSPYYIEVNFYSEGDTRNSKFSISAGNQNWKSDCSLNVKDKSNLATCTNESFYSITDSGSIYLVKILSIVGKVDQNAG